MGNKSNLGKALLRKRGRRPNTGCFGSKKRRLDNTASCQASTSDIQEKPTGNSQFTELMPVQLDFSISSREKISEQGCKVDKVSLASSAICDEPTRNSQFTEFMPVPQEFSISSREKISEQGCKVDEVSLASSTICDEENDGYLIISPSNEEQTSEIVIGRRILDMTYFFNKFKEFANHNGLFNCGTQCLSLVGEKRIGLKSKFKFKCDMCARIFHIDSEDPKSTENVDINISTVIGVVSTGIGYSQFEELATTINVPVFSEKYFLHLQDDVYNKWEETAFELMEAANERERQAAIAVGKVDKNGIALIDVYADGCWSARSYGNNYKALSGAAAIIGRQFGEVLFMAVKNKYCAICARAEKKGTEAKEHICYKNYDGSSTGMEAEIISEGFKNSVEMHNVIYHRLIADGDSATYQKILTLNPYNDTIVIKIECRNHILRNLCNKLRTLSKDVKYPITYRKLLTDKKILSIRKVVVRSIKENKQFVKEGKYSEGIQNLNDDIQNSSLHAFGDHRNCKSYYCDKDNSLLNSMEYTNSTFWFRLKVIINTVAGKCQSLIEDVDTNTAERFNSIIAKMVGGKRINFSTRRSYQGRCSAAVVSFNTRLPNYTIQKKCLGKSPKSSLKKMEERRKRRQDYNRKHPYKKNRMLNKINKNKQNDYGENSATPDMSQDCLEKAKQEFLKNLNVLTSDRDRIQKDTILQRNSNDWLELRKNMVTASNFGKIVKRKNKTSCQNLVKALLYKENLSHVASIAHGIENEKLAIEQLAKQENITIDPCGLFVDSEFPFIGATPDGLIGNDTVVEVKCPITAFKKGIEEAIKENKIQIYRFDKKKQTYCINKNCDWYYQIQGQLHVTQRAKCLFAIWAGENNALKIEYIDRDDNFWRTNMETKLVKFFMDCLLPEIVNPRHTRGMPIRDPKENENKANENENKENGNKENENMIIIDNTSMIIDNCTTGNSLEDNDPSVQVRKLDFFEF